MPTTTYTDAVMSASAIGSRTDSAGAAAVDYSAEEARLSQVLFGAGAITPGAYVVAAQAAANMTVRVGSGVAKADVYALSGTSGGQGTYLARLDATSATVAIGAADASQTRTDEVWLVVLDNTYDATTRGLPRLGYRKGDLGGANPGPDATWKAAALLARVAVAANATTITAGVVSDQRAGGGLRLSTAAQVNLGGSASPAALAVQTANPGTVVQGVRVAGDSSDRFTASGDGTLSWGSGSSAPDATLTRPSAGVLRASGDLQVTGGISLPRGVIARAGRSTDSPSTTTTNPAAAQGVLRVGANLLTGRRYRISTGTIQVSAQTSGGVFCQINYTVDGSPSYPSSGRLVFTTANAPTSFQPYAVGTMEGFVTPSSNLYLSAILTVYSLSGQIVATYSRGDSQLELIIEDMGVDPGPTGVAF